VKPGIMLPAAGLASALAWLQLGGTPGAARLWAVVLLVPLPLLMILQGRKLAEIEELPRTEAYASSIVSLWLLAFATAAVGLVSGYDAAMLGLVTLPLTETVLLTAVLTAAGVAVLFAFRFAGVTEPDIVRQLMPVTRRDRALFVGVSVTAGVCEEIVFRGFLIHVLHTSTGSLPLALLLSSGAFGVAHAYQQPIGAVRAALLGLILAIPFVYTGSLVPSIIAHAMIDILSGLWLSRHLLHITGD